MIDIKRFRKEKKLTQQEFAEEVGIDRSRISGYENGKDVTDYLEDAFIARYPELKSYRKYETEETVTTASEPAVKYITRAEEVRLMIDNIEKMQQLYNKGEIDEETLNFLKNYQKNNK